MFRLFASRRPDRSARSVAPTRVSVRTRRGSVSTRCAEPRTTLARVILEALVELQTTLGGRMDVLGQRGKMTAGELFQQHASFVSRFLRRLGVTTEALDDAIQEVFLVVHRRGGFAPGPAEPTSYLAAIAMYVAADQRRRARAEAARFDEADVDEVALASGADPAHHLETQDRLRIVRLALSKLDPALRMTLLLADGEGDTCVSIAVAMNVPVGTVYWRLSRARKKFHLALTSVEAAEGRTRAVLSCSAPPLRSMPSAGSTSTTRAARLSSASCPR